MSSKKQNLPELIRILFWKGFSLLIGLLFFMFYFLVLVGIFIGARPVEILLFLVVGAVQGMLFLDLIENLDRIERKN